MIEDLAQRLFGTGVSDLHPDRIPGSLQASFSRKVSSEEADRIQALLS